MMPAGAGISSVGTLWKLPMTTAVRLLHVRHDELAHVALVDLYLIKEHARHLGHAGRLRERTDGAVRE
jgi:Protein of unknown function (DUF664)